MSDGFTADADRLAAQAEHFDGFVGRVGAIRRDLADALEAAGPCWGGDEVGQSFATTHAGAADDTLGRLGGLSDQLGSVGTRFTETAAAYRDLDSGAAETLAATSDTDV